MLSEFPMQFVDKDNTQGGRQEHRETSWRLLPIYLLFDILLHLLTYSSELSLWLLQATVLFCQLGQQGTLQSS